MAEEGGFEGLTKKEILGLSREQEKLERSLGGIKNMRALPDVLFVVDVDHEDAVPLLDRDVLVVVLDLDEDEVLGTRQLLDGRPRKRHPPPHLAQVAAHLVTGVDAADAASSSPTRMKQNRPNPFRPETVIAFTLGEPGPVSLRIFDVSGRVIRTLVDEELRSRDYEMVWDGLD